MENINKTETKKIETKKSYETPSAEKVEFLYQEQVAASPNCVDVWVNTGTESCTSGNAHWEKLG